MKSCELLSSLGLSEHCGTLVCVTDYASDDAMNAKWLCRCGGELGHLSFGYDKATRGAKKVKWVGPDGKWNETEPKEDFKLGEMRVIMRMPAYLL